MPIGEPECQTPSNRYLLSDTSRAFCPPVDTVNCCRQKVAESDKVNNPIWISPPRSKSRQWLAPIPAPDYRTSRISSILNLILIFAANLQKSLNWHLQIFYAFSESKKADIFNVYRKNAWNFSSIYQRKIFHWSGWLLPLTTTFQIQNWLINVSYKRSNSRILALYQSFNLDLAVSIERSIITICEPYLITSFWPNRINSLGYL